MIARLAALLGLLAFVLPAAAAPKSVTLIEPYGAESSTGTAAGLLREALARRLGVPVELRSVPCEAGGKAQDAVAAAPADGSVLLVGQLLTPWAFRPRPAPGVMLDAFVPVARLTPGLSTVLFVAAASPIRSWSDFAAEAKAGKVAMAWNGNLLFAIPMAMMEGEFGKPFPDVAAHDRAAVIGAVTTGKAQAGLLPTVSLLAHWPDPKLRPIVTFGGGRNKVLDVPTYREAGSYPVKAITGSLAVFAPPGTPAPVVKQLGAAFIAAGADAAARKDAKLHHFPLAVTGPEEVREAMARDTRVYRKLGTTLREPK